MSWVQDKADEYWGDMPDDGVDFDELLAAIRETVQKCADVARRTGGCDGECLSSILCAMNIEALDKP